MLLAATAFNLKKYLKFKPLAVISQAIALQKEPEKTFLGHYTAFTTLFFSQKPSNLSACITLRKKQGGYNSCATATVVLRDKF